MHAIVDWVLLHAEHASWLLFCSILLAGFNVPISIDILVILAGFLAATVMPDRLWHLYFAIFFGAYFSAWIGYWFGRLLGHKLCKWKWFNRIVSPEKIERMHQFYNRFGLWTFLVGRFIPFGVRNCLFMSSGISRISFLKFALWDLGACLLWSSCSFYCSYTLGHNYHALFDRLQIVHIALFTTFSVTLIAMVWYRRKRRVKNESI